MGRPKKPKNVILLSGGYKKHPERLRAREGEPEDDRPLGDCPEHLTPSQRQCWHEIATHAIPGVLGKSDGLAVEIAAGLFAKLRTGGIRGFELSQLNRLLGKLGMTPSDRASINIPQTKPRNTFADD